MFLQLSKSRIMITLSFSFEGPLLEKMMQTAKEYLNHSSIFIRPRLDPARPLEMCFDIAKAPSSSKRHLDMKPILEASLTQGQNQEKIQQIASWDEEMILKFDFESHSFENFLQSLFNNMLRTLNDTATVDQASNNSPPTSAAAAFKSHTKESKDEADIVAEHSQKSNTPKEGRDEVNLASNQVNQSSTLEDLQAASLLSMLSSLETNFRSDKEKASLQSGQIPKSFNPQYTAASASTPNPVNENILKKVGDYLANKLGAAFMERNKDKFTWTLVSDGQGKPIGAELTSSLTEGNQHWFLKRFPNCTFEVKDTSVSNKPKGIVCIPIPKEVLSTTDEPSLTTAFNLPSRNMMQAKSKTCLAPPRPE